MRSESKIRKKYKKLDALDKYHGGDILNELEREQMKTLEWVLDDE